MKICNGWVFYTADFSVPATSGRKEPGFVQLSRNTAGREKWLRMPQEEFDDPNGPPLYVTGRGLTMEDAIADANIKAQFAKPITKERTEA